MATTGMGGDSRGGARNWVPRERAGKVLSSQGVKGIGEGREGVRVRSMSD